MGEVGILVYAYGALVVLMLIEMFVSYRRRDGHYRSSELNASLSMAIGYQLFELFTRSLTLFPYIALASLSNLQLPTGRVWGWIVGFVLVDLFGYIGHRIMHEVNLFWALHEGHHSGEEYNLGMGPRQSFFVGLAQPLFVLPLASIVPVEMLVTLQAFELLWGLFLHTPYIGKLGFLEEVFSTPSHHRVHHGRNAKYIDRNHGNVLIIWDRLFGTFQREEETPVYGITSPLASHGIWEASTHRFRELWYMARQTERLRDKVSLWFRRPDYRPADLGGPVQLVDSDMRRYRLPNTQASRALMVYTTVQFFVAASALPWLIFHAERLTLFQTCLVCTFILWALSSTTDLLAERRNAIQNEGLRLLLSAALLATFFPSHLGAGPYVWAAPSLLGLMIARATRSVPNLTSR